MPCLSLEKRDGHRPAPEDIVHDRTARHARDALHDEGNVAFDVVVAGPDRDGVFKSLVLIVLGRPPEIELSANTLHVGREDRDVVALPFAVVEGYGLLCRSPLDGKLAAPHGARVLVPDRSWLLRH